MNLGDLAERVAQQLLVEASAPVAEASALTEEAALEAENSLIPKIRFSWKPEDRAALERIRGAAETMFEEAFGTAISVVDDFYLQLRVPRQRDGIVVRDAEGRPVWEVDDNGRPVEDWNQLCGQDIESTLANLARLRFQIAPQVNQLFLEALFARMSASDSHDEAWGEILEGTQGDRQARSNRKSQQDRYAAYFRFYLYSTAKTFLDEIDQWSRMLTNFRAWGVRSQNG